MDSINTSNFYVRQQVLP